MNHIQSLASDQTWRDLEILNFKVIWFIQESNPGPPAQIWAKDTSAVAEERTIIEFQKIFHLRT